MGRRGESVFLKSTSGAGSVSGSHTAELVTSHNVNLSTHSGTGSFSFVVYDIDHVSLDFKTVLTACYVLLPLIKSLGWCKDTGDICNNVASEMTEQSEGGHE